MTVPASRVFTPILCALTGLLLAFSVSVGVRLSTGRPPGQPPAQFGHLLGERAPGFELPAPTGQPYAFTATSLPRGGLLYFGDTDCSACQAALPSLKEAAGLLPVIVVSSGDREQLVQLAEGEAPFAAVLWDSARSVRQRYQVFRLPSALLVDPMGRVRAGAHGSSCVDRLMPACQALVRRGP